MPDFLEVTCGSSRMVLAPSLGGGIAALDYCGKPVLRPWSASSDSGLFALALNMLVPFSNRIAGGGFNWNSKYYSVDPNFEAEPFPIHGDGFQRCWQASELAPSCIKLSLEDGLIGPWRYRADNTFQLSDHSLIMTLKIMNLANEELPFGFGFHPWFPRNSETRLSFHASGIWLEDEDYLPTQHIALPDSSSWSFSRTRALPPGWINNAYTDWMGNAEIAQGNEFVSLKVSASKNLDCAIVHSVDEGCDFFCFEPVSHAVDAVNQPGAPGMMALNTGETIECWMKLDWIENA